MYETNRHFIPRLYHILNVLGILSLLSGRLLAVDANQPELILPIGHSALVTSAALSSDSKLVLTGSEDRTAILWDVATAWPIQTFKGHTAHVTSVALSRDGRRAITGSADRTAILWDVETGHPVQTLKGHSGIVVSVALSGDGKRALTGSIDGTAILWDASTANAIRTFDGHPEGVTSVAFSGDGKQVLTGSIDRTAILWDVETGHPVQTLKGHSGIVVSVALSGDSTQILTGSEDRTAILWDIATAQPIHTFKHQAGPVFYVAFSGDGKRVLTGSVNETAILWNAETARPIQTFAGPNGPVRSAALSGDGRRVFIGSSFFVAWTGVLLDAETACRIQTFEGHTQRIESVAVSGDGRRVLTGYRFSKSAELWDTETAKCIRTFGERSDGDSFALSTDANRVLIRSWNKSAMLWDVTTPRSIQSFKGHTRGVVYSAALSSDGTRVVTGSGDETAILWDATTSKPLQMFRGHTGVVSSVAVSGDGKRVLTGSSDGTAILWDAETAKPLQTLKGHTHDVWRVALTNDGKRALTGSYDEATILWDTDASKPVRSFEGKVALSGDGERVLTGSGDRAILWNASTGKQLQIFRSLGHSVSSVAFGSGNSFVVTGSDDGTVWIWKPGHEKPVFSFLSSGGEWLFWTPEGYYTCSPNGENLIAWKIHDDSPPHNHIVGPEQFRKKFYRPDMFRHLLRELDVTRALALADKDRGVPVELPGIIAKALPPNVDIVKPDRDVEIGDEKLTVEAHAFSVGDHPVTRMRLLINGRPYQGNLSTFEVPEPKLGKAKRSWDVELEPGEYQVQVIAESDVSYGQSDTLRVRRKAMAETLPRLVVLAIGVTAYEKESLRKNVSFAAADARKFADTVERSSKPLYREIKVVRLIDQDATRRGIIQELTQIRKWVGQNDAVIIFYAGHGTRDDQTNFYFLPVDADPDDVSSTGLSEGDFKARVKALPGKVILILDACHSGTLIENRGRSVDGPLDKLYRDLKSNEYGVVMMCSSMGLEESLESPQHKSGMFALALVEGLEGKAPISTEGAVYLSALERYIADRVKELSDGKQHPLMSHPTIKDIPLTKP